jgi:hypothetical protein
MLKLNQKEMEKKVQVSINRTPSFTEVWHEGSVEFDGKTHNFWLINPRGRDEQGREYEIEVRWWFKQVPMEVRRMHEEIVNSFIELQNDKGTK